MTDRFKSKVEALAPWAAGLFLALPVLVAFYPPMTDLPYHEASLGLLRHFFDPTMCPPGLYELNLGEPNQLFHMVGWALAYVVSTRWAIKLIVAAAIVAIPVCAARFARHVGASPLAALVLAPIALGWLVSWGLLANLVGLAALLAVLPGLDRFAREPTGRGAVRCLGAALLLYFAHESTLVVYAGVALALALLHPWAIRRTALRLSPVIASALAAAAQLKWQVRFTPKAVRTMPTQWHSPLHKLIRIPYLTQATSEPEVQNAILGICVFCIGSFFWLRARERRRSAPPAKAEGSRFERTRAWALAHRWELFVAVCLAAYMAVPFTWNGATLIYERWFPPGFAVLAVIAAPRDLWTRAARAPVMAVAALPLATVLVNAPSFVDSSRVYGELEPLVPLIAPGSSVAGIDIGPGTANRTFFVGPAAGRILAERGGRLAFSFTNSSISPVVTPPRYQWDEPMMRIGFDSMAFRPAHDFKRFRYVLAHVGDPRRGLVLRYALGHEARFVADSGEWMLFESKIEPFPVVSGSVSIIGPPPETIQDRFKLLSQRMVSPTERQESAAGAAAQQP